MFTLKYKTEISSAHQLPNAYNEKCHNLHGHTYKVLVEIKTPVLVNDMVIDFKLLKDRIDYFDHKNLNDLITMPTTERLAETLYYIILVAVTEAEIKNAKVKITVFESDKSSITYEN